MPVKQTTEQKHLKNLPEAPRRVLDVYTQLDGIITVRRSAERKEEDLCLLLFECENNEVNSRIVQPVRFPLRFTPARKSVLRHVDRLRHVTGSIKD